jgi:hypothetical protein
MEGIATAAGLANRSRGGRRWLRVVAGAGVILGLGVFWVWQASANFTPSFVAEFGFEHVATDQRGRNTVRLFSAKGIRFQELSEAARKEFEAQDYDSVDAGTAAWVFVKGELAKAILTRDHYYLPSGKKVYEPGSAGLMLYDYDAIADRVADRLRILDAAERK